MIYAKYMSWNAIVAKLMWPENSSRNKVFAFHLLNAAWVDEMRMKLQNYENVLEEQTPTTFS